MNIKMIPCTRCGEEMPEIRLTKFGYDFCVNCSKEQPKIGRVVTLGEGDHTWNDIEFLNPVEDETEEEDWELYKSILEDQEEEEEEEDGERKENN